MLYKIGDNYEKNCGYSINVYFMDKDYWEGSFFKIIVLFCRFFCKYCLFR